jgi:alkylhydroperoxidase family enzyme
MAQDRMPEIPADQMTDAQKTAASEFAEGRGYAVRGPFAAMLRSPEVMLRAKAMGDYVRFKSTIPARLNELAIIITARQWSQNYEWQAHRPLAEKAGIRPEIAQAIADGRRPIGMGADEEIGAPHGCANAPAVTRQGTHGMAADKAGCAKYRRQASLLAPQHAYHLRIQWHLRASNNATARGCEAAQARRVGAVDPGPIAVGLPSSRRRCQEPRRLQLTRGAPRSR